MDVVPAATIKWLQERFLFMIKTDLDGRPERAHLRVPDVNVLTALEVPELWFPIGPDLVIFAHTLPPRTRPTLQHQGYVIRLDGRELVAMRSDAATVDKPIMTAYPITRLFGQLKMPSSSTGCEHERRIARVLLDKDRSTIGSAGINLRPERGTSGLVSPRQARNHAIPSMAYLPTVES